MSTISNADVFIEKYKLLEETVRSTYNLKDSDSISFCLSGKAEFQKFRDDIKYCQDVRNLLSHKKKINDCFAVEPSQQMICFINDLIRRIKSRRKCFEIQIKLPAVCWESLNGNVRRTMETMRDNLYSHIPILENGVVIGVFDENAMFNYLTCRGATDIDNELTFADIRDFLMLEGRESEKFLFVKADSYVDDLEKSIEKSFKVGKRIDIAFVTQSGNAKEKLQGIITPWDIIADSERE